MKVLVTGVCGNLGSTLTRRLIQEKHQVRGFDLPTEGNKEVAAELGKIEMVWGDVTDPKSVTKAIDNDVDTVIHDVRREEAHIVLGTRRNRSGVSVGSLKYRAS